MRLLVTGGAGFIGSHYVRSALRGQPTSSDAASVTVLDALTYAGSRDNLADVADSAALTFVEGDVRDAALVDALMAQTDEVVHFAAESHVDRSIAGADAFVSTNVVGTQTLLDAAVRHRVSRFVHVSTDEVYGSVESGAADEQAPLRPSSPYSASKAGADMLAQAYHRTFGLAVTVTRCSNNYGPFQLPEKVVPLFVTELLEGGSVPLYGDGGQVRDWLHVEDHCRAVDLVRARGRPGEVYNVAGGTELTNRELTARLLDLCGADESRVRNVADRLGHDQRYSLDAAKIARELGFAPAVAFDDGLADTVRWYRDNPAWWRAARARVAAAGYAG